MATVVFVKAYDTVTCVDFRGAWQLDSSTPSAWRGQSNEPPHPPAELPTATLASSWPACVCPPPDCPLLGRPSDGWKLWPRPRRGYIRRATLGNNLSCLPPFRSSSASIAELASNWHRHGASDGPCLHIPSEFSSYLAPAATSLSARCRPLLLRMVAELLILGLMQVMPSPQPPAARDRQVWDKAALTLLHWSQRTDCTLIPAYFHVCRAAQK